MAISRLAAFALAASALVSCPSETDMCGETETTAQGVYVESNGFPVRVEEVGDVIESTLYAWAPLLECDLKSQVQPSWIAFRTLPFRDSRMPIGDLAGLTVDPVIHVGYREPLTETALAHELGHLVLGRCLGDWTEATLLRYHQEQGTPY